MLGYAFCFKPKQRYLGVSEALFINNLLVLVLVFANHSIDSINENFWKALHHVRVSNSNHIGQSQIAVTSGVSENNDGFVYGYLITRYGKSLQPKRVATLLNTIE